MKLVYKRRSVAAIAASSATLMLLSGVSAASAEEQPSTVDAIAAVAPEALDNVASSSTDELPATSAGTITADALDLTVELPFPEAGAPAQYDSGVAWYDNENSSSTIPLIKEDGSLQVLTVIDDPEAPTRYAYNLDLPDGSTASLDDGLVTIINADGSFGGGVAPAWALDADGNPVLTHYELDGSTLTQVIEHDDASAYPIVADPWFGIDLFSAIYTSSENGQPRYLLARSAWGVAVSQGTGVGIAGIVAGQQIMLGAGWDEAKNKQPGLLSKASLRQQYDCHVFYAAFKPGTWNLEKWRSNYSGWGGNALSHQCNW